LKFIIADSASFGLDGVINYSLFSLDRLYVVKYLNSISKNVP